MREASDVADFRHQANGADLINAAQRLQRTHHRLEAPPFEFADAAVSRTTRSSAAMTACQYSVNAVCAPASPKFDVANQR